MRASAMSTSEAWVSMSLLVTKDWSLSLSRRWYWLLSASNWARADSRLAISVRLSNSISSDSASTSSPDLKLMAVTIPDSSVVISTPWKATSVPTARIRRFHCALSALATVTLIGGGSWLPCAICSWICSVFLYASTPANAINSVNTARIRSHRRGFRVSRDWSVTGLLSMPGVRDKWMLESRIQA